MKLKFAILALVVSAVSAFGQSNISYFTHAAKTPQLVTACNAAGEALRKGLAEFPHPSDWKYIVVCDDATWTEAMATEHIQARADLTYGATFLKTHVTLFRGAGLRDESKDVTAEHLIAHELCHINLNSLDDEKVDKQATAWVQARIIASK